MPDRTAAAHGYRMLELAAAPDAWATLDSESLKQLTHWQCTQYALSGDAERIVPLGSLYQLLVQRTSAAERSDLLQSLATGIVAEGHVNALLPFLFEEPEHTIISSAALNHAVAMQPRDGDPLAGPRYVREIAENHTEDDARKGSILAGVLLLGDRRTLPILRGCWRFLGRDGRARLVNARSGWVYASVIDFLLDWIEDATKRCLAPSPRRSSTCAPPPSTRASWTSSASSRCPPPATAPSRGCAKSGRSRSTAASSSHGCAG
jgi:hypothetical protein